jgi:signal transduction histidine kinase
LPTYLPQSGTIAGERFEAVTVPLKVFLQKHTGLIAPCRKHCKAVLEARGLRPIFQMINYQGNQDFVQIDRLRLESDKLHLPQLAETVSVQKFLDRIMQHQVDPAQIGRQICQIIATNSDLEILRQIANTLGVACQADFCFVAAVADRKVVNPKACWQNKSDPANHLDAPANVTPISKFPQTTTPDLPATALEHPVLIETLASNGAIAISDIQDFPETDAPASFLTALPCRAILAVSTRFGGDVNGTIIIGKSQPHEWLEADLQLLESVSDAIASAIASIQKDREIAKLNQQLQRQADYKNLLNKVAASIDTNSEIELILQRVIETTTDTLQVNRGQILLLKYTDPLFKTRSPNRIPKVKVELVCEFPLQKDADRPSIEPIEGRKKSSTSKTKNKEKTTNSRSKTSQSKSDRFPTFWMSESSLCETAFQQAPQSLAIAGARELLAQQQEQVKQILKLQDISAVLLVPLVGTNGQGTVLGFLVLQHSSPRQWQPEELEVVELVATQLSTAIIQTQTLKQVQSLVEDRTSQLKQSLEVQAKLYEQSRRQVEQLQRLNQLKDEFLDTVGHELKTPLTIIRMAVRNLREFDLSPAQRVKYLDILDLKCTQEINLIDDLLKLKELESQQAPISRLNIEIKPLIQDLARSFEEKWADSGLTLQAKLPKRSLSLKTNFDSLQRILLELLTNAGKFSAVGTSVVLELSEAGGQIVLKVSNLGQGIARDDLDHIFEKFRRGKGITDRAIPGTGLGLALVKCLVEHLNGTIEVSSSPSDNSENNELWRTCFTLTLPQFVEEISDWKQ